MNKVFLIILVFAFSLDAKKIIDSSFSSKGIKKGFYYYDDYENNNTNPKRKKVQASPAQAMQADLTKQLIEAMKENNKIQHKILKRLEYAFPYTIPEFTIHKKTGIKCKSNSSADCFVMPVIKEAQNSVPVMKDMLRDPSAKNVKKYLEWQAVYLNQSFKIGRGFSLMNKQYEREMNKMNGMSMTPMPTDGNKQKDMAFLKKSLIIKKLGEKLGLMVFVGKTRELERNFSGKEYTSLLHSSFAKMKNITYVYDSQEDKDFVEQRIKKFKYDDDWKKYQKIRSIISPEQFKRFKISTTPASLIIYKKDDGAILWQKLGYSIAPRAMARTIFHFLSFHSIIKPGVINEKDNWEIATDLRKGNKISQKIIDSIDINESSISVESTQILVTPKKKENDAH